MNFIFKILVLAYILGLSACAQLKDLAAEPNPANNIFAQRQQMREVDMVKQASSLSGRLRALIPGTALYEELESACKAGKFVEVIVPVETSASLAGKKTCFPVHFSSHPAVKPQTNVFIVDRTDLFVGGHYFGTATKEVMEEYNFQRTLKMFRG